MPVRLLPVGGQRPPDRGLGRAGGKNHKKTDVRMTSTGSSVAAQKKRILSKSFFLTVYIMKTDSYHKTSF